MGVHLFYSAAPPGSSPSGERSLEPDTFDWIDGRRRRRRRERKAAEPPLGTKGRLGNLAKVWSLRRKKMDKCLLSLVFCLSITGKSRLFISASFELINSDPCSRWREAIVEVRLEICQL